MALIPSVLSVITAGTEGKGDGSHTDAAAATEVIAEGSALFTQVVAGLNDPVSAVRLKAAESVGGIVDVTGAEWFTPQLVLC